MLAAAGGAENCCLYGISSGALLALEAVNRGVAVRKLAIHETPVVVDDSRSAIPAEYREHLRTLIEAGRNGAAVKYFTRAAVGLPVPAGRFAGVQAPTLVIYGGKSPAWMRTVVRQLTDTVPGVRCTELPGQTHMVKPAVLAPVLAEHFSR
ncbi:MAG TPA: hypothetical protein VH372_05890 [Actinospica sp.]|nr:hypothetical protein [Actinospica sp.]